MKKAFVISIFCSLLFLFITGNAMGICTRAADETTRIQTARAILQANASNYASVINYWADDITYKDPFLTNNGRTEMLAYLDGFYSGSIYGWPDDKEVTIINELWDIERDPDTGLHVPGGDFIYWATLKWTGTSPLGFYFQTGMSILKFRDGEGCPYYHRDYWTEGDSWYQVPDWKAEGDLMRGIYIGIMGLEGRCFDDDQDGYTKYRQATGCPNPGLDCNDFVPGINPGATEIPGNGINDDCNIFTPTWGTDPASIISAEFKESSDIANYLILIGLPLGAVLFLRRLRRKK